MIGDMNDEIQKNAFKMSDRSDRTFSSNIIALKKGMNAGIPIAVGYFAVSFTLGIAARNAGLNAFQGFLASLLNNASAGEYAGFALIAADATYLEVLLVTLITNARYLLMSFALSQKLSPNTPIHHRLLLGYAVTDEIFGISVSRPGYLNPYYTFGAILIAIPCWAVGTIIGVVAGNVLPLRAVSALSVALYGMFLAVIIPPGRKDKILTVLVIVSFVLSFISEKLPPLAHMSAGTRTIFLTVILSGLAAILFPLSKKEVDVTDES